MDESTGGAGLWIAGIVGLIAIGTWLALGGPRDSVELRREANVPASIPTPARIPIPTVIPVPPKELEVGSPVPRIAAHGRLTIDHATFPNEGLLDLDLELPDEDRGSGERAVKVISTDGRRIDITATPLPGTGSGIRLRIDPGFLTQGRYMIETDSDVEHPLQIRRFVLEVR